MAIYLETGENNYLSYTNQPDGAKTLSKNVAEFTYEDKNNISELMTDAALVTEKMELFGNDVTIYKKNGIVQVDYYGASKIALTGSADVLVGTLPEGFRPVVRVCHELYNSSASKIQITFNTDGTIKVYNFGSTLAANSGFIRDFFQFFAA